MFVPIGSNSGDDYQTQRSLRFRQGAWLQHSFTVPGNRRLLTYSGWVKRGNLATQQTLLGTSEKGASFGYGVTLLTFSAAGALRFAHTRPDNGGSLIECDSASLFRDPLAWYHVVLCVDTVQASGTNGVKLYVNGSQQTLSFATYTQNSDLFWTDGDPSTNKYIGRGSAISPTNYLDGHLAEITLVDGQALTPSSFGESDASGNWRPKQYTGTYGTNGFRLDFSDPTSLTTLMADRSGNGNNWTANNISLTAGATYDSMLDVPLGGGGGERGNYATLNPLDFTTVGTLTSGNLKFTQISAFSRSGRASIGMSSGKWYWEVTCTQGNISPGIGNASMSLGGYVGADSNGWSFGSDGLKYNGGSGSAYSSIYNVNDVIGIAYDTDTGSLTFYKNGVSQGVAFTGIGGTMFPAFSSSGSGNVIADANFGQRPFAYSPPSGFKALHTGNLTSDSVTVSGSFTGNVSADGPFIWVNGAPETLTINGNAVTWGTHADKLATGFKIRTASSSYNSSGTNTWTATYLSPSSKSAFKYQNAKVN